MVIFAMLEILAEFVFLLFMLLFFKMLISGIKISSKLNIKLKKIGKISGKYLDTIQYMKQRLPWGGFSRNFDNFYDSDDTEDIKELKTLIILHTKKSRKTLIISILSLFSSMFFSYFYQDEMSEVLSIIKLIMFLVFFLVIMFYSIVVTKTFIVELMKY